MTDSGEAGRTIVLPADPYEAGRVLGALWGKRLSRRIEIARAQIAAHPALSSRVASRVASFRDLLADIAPHWLDEVRGIASAAGVDEQGILLLNSVPLPDPGPGSDHGNCSAFLWLDADGTALFKIRDEQPHPQVVYAYQDGAGRIVQVGKDIGNIGVAHGIVNGGLAGGNNTGSSVSDVAEEPRLNDCHLLRYVLENAGATGDAESLLQKLLDRGAVGGASPDRGSILLFAGPDSGIIAELSGTRLAVQTLSTGRQVRTNHFRHPEAVGWRAKEDGDNTQIRLGRLSELIGAESWDRLTQASFAASRDRANAPHALCNDDSTKSGMTVSAQLHLIPKAGPALSFMCCGNPLNSVFLPLPSDRLDIPGPLVSGAWFDRTHALYRAFGCSNRLRNLIDSLEVPVLAGQVELADTVKAFLDRSLTE